MPARESPGNVPGHNTGSDHQKDGRANNGGDSAHDFSGQGLADQRSILNIYDAGADPAIGVVPAMEPKLEVIISERFGELATITGTRGIQGDHIDGLTDEAAHESKFLLGSQFAENAVALAGNLDLDLIGHHCHGSSGAC